MYTAAEVPSRGKSGNYLITPQTDNKTLGNKIIITHLPY